MSLCYKSSNMQKFAVIFSMLIVFTLTTVLHDAFSHCHGDSCAAFKHGHDHGDDDNNDTDKDQGEVAKHSGHTHIFGTLDLSNDLPSYYGMKEQAVVAYKSGTPLHLAEPLLQPPSQA